MANSTEEIGIWKRLAAVEEAVRELKKQDLVVAKRLGKMQCRVFFNLGLTFLKGEEHSRFEQFCREKREAVDEEIENCRAVEKVFDIVDQFGSELVDYITAVKVDTADKAMEIAHSFIKKYSPVALPMKAVKEGDVWLVDIDVGALAVKIAKVKVDARTGDIVGYEIPPK